MKIKYTEDMFNEMRCNASAQARLLWENKEKKQLEVLKIYVDGCIDDLNKTKDC